jgi:hypothetical protein
VGHAARRLRAAADQAVRRAVTGPLGDAAGADVAPASVEPHAELRDAVRGAFRPDGS